MDRLGHIEALLAAAALIAEAPSALADLVPVAKAARDVLAAVMWDPTRHHELSTTRVCNTCGAAWPCEFARLRAALDKFAGAS